VRDLREAVDDPHFALRGLFARRVALQAGTLPALPVPIAEAFRAPEVERRAPALGAQSKREPG
jgi:alpha-methylacyl-CoA racemase